MGWLSSQDRKTEIDVMKSVIWEKGIESQSAYFHYCRHTHVDTVLYMYSSVVLKASKAFNFLFGFSPYVIWLDISFNCILHTRNNVNLKCIPDWKVNLWHIKNDILVFFLSLWVFNQSKVMPRPVFCGAKACFCYNKCLSMNINVRQCL